MAEKIKILLTGASGSVGYEVLKQLSKRTAKYELTVFDINLKSSRKKLTPFSKQAKIIYGDISSKKDISKACHTKDVVIHLAAIIPPLADQKPTLTFQVNTKGTQYLIEALEDYSPNAFFLYSSSVSAYGDRLIDPMINTGDPLTPSKGDEYAKTKLAAETIIQNSNLDWSIFRLCAIMGGHKMSNLMFHQPLNTSMEIATPEDTARAFVNAIHKQQQLSKKIFNLGGGESCRIIYRDYLSRSFKLAGLGYSNFPLNSFAEKNFHCGYYQDGDDLENILKFRNDTMESHFEKEKLKYGPLKRLFISIFRIPIKRYLHKQSDPNLALKSKNKQMIDLYFN